MRKRCVNCGKPCQEHGVTCGDADCLLALAWLCKESCTDQCDCADCFVWNTEATIDEQLVDDVAAPPVQRGMA